MTMDIMTEAKPAETLTRQVKLIFTVSIYSVFVGFGLSASMLSPARLDIAELVGSDFEHVSIGTSIKAGAGCVGALFFGWFFTKVNRQLGMVTCIFVAALSMFVVPFLRKLWLYYASEVGNGIFAFGIDVAGNAWILEIWQEDANPYMQGMHFSFALGLALGPLYLEPFLSPDRNMTDDGQSESEWNRNGTAGQESRIVVPYTISTIFMIATGALMLYLHFRIPYKELKRSVSSPKSSDISDGNNLITNPVDVRDEKRYYLSLIVLGSLLLCFYTGLELSTMNFLPEFVHVIDLKLTKSRGAFMASVMSGAFAANRLISIAVATRIKAKTMLYVSFGMLTTGNMILLIFANTSEVMLWIAIIIIGLGHSCVLPCIMSFLEERMNVTTSICGIFLLSSCVSLIATPLLIGSFVETYPMTYVYINIAGLTACALIFSCLFTIDRRYRRKMKDLLLMQS